MRMVWRVGGVREGFFALRQEDAAQKQAPLLPSLFGKVSFSGNSESSCFFNFGQEKYLLKYFQVVNT